MANLQPNMQAAGTALGTLATEVPLISNLLR